MHIYKTRQFERWASKEGLADSVLAFAVSEMEKGLVDADLGGHAEVKAVAPELWWHTSLATGHFLSMALPKMNATTSMPENLRC